MTPIFFALLVGVTLSAALPPSPTIPPTSVPSQNPVPSGPIATFESTILDLGNIQKPVSSAFQLTNTGSERLFIERVQSDCGCTATKPVANVLAPGESSAIEFTFTPPNDTEGDITKNIQVFTNDPKASPITLTLRAKTIAPFSITPNVLIFSKVNRGETKAGDVVLSSNRGFDLKVTSVKGPGNEPWIKAKTGAGKHSVHVRFDSSLLPRDTIYGGSWVNVRTNDPIAPEVNFYVSFNLRPIVYAIPENLNVTAVGQKFDFVVKHHGGKPFKILSATSPWGVQASFDTFVPKSEHIFQVAVLPSAKNQPKGTFKSYFQIQTSDPEVPTVWVPVNIAIR